MPLRRVVAIFQNPGPGYDTLYVAMAYVLEGSGGEPVCICGPDSIRSHGWAELLILADPDNELTAPPPKTEPVESE